MPHRSQSLVVRIALKIILPATFWGCITGMLAVMGLGLGVLCLRGYLPDGSTPYLAVGVPLVGGAGLLFYWFRLIYFITNSEDADH